MKEGDEMVELLIYILACGFIWGFVSKGIAYKRGMNGGFWWGFFLGVIGIMVVAVRPKK